MARKPKPDLKRIKLAKLKQKEAELSLYIKKGYDDKTITQTRNEIQQLKSELKK